MSRRDKNKENNSESQIAQVRKFYINVCRCTCKSQLKMLKYNIIAFQVPEAAEKDSDAELYESSDDDAGSSDEDRSWVKEVKKQHKIIRKKHELEEDLATDGKFYELNSAPKTTSSIKSITRVSKKSLGDRLANEGFTMVTGTSGNREMKFTMRGKKSISDNQKKMRKHHQERRQIVRKTGYLMKKKLSKM